MVIASGLVVLSGITMVLLQTGITAVFTEWKNWSTIIIAKILLTIAMLTLAIYQTLKWKRTGKFLTGHLIKNEWIIGLVALMLGVWMSQIAYPIPVKPYEETFVDKQVKAEVYISELKTGDREMSVNISGLEGRHPEHVHVKISMPEHDMDSGELTVDEVDSGEYTTDLPFTMSGTWRLEITATYPEGEKIEWKDDIFITGSN